MHTLVSRGEQNLPMEVPTVRAGHLVASHLLDKRMLALIAVSN